MNRALSPWFRQWLNDRKISPDAEWLLLSEDFVTTPVGFQSLSEAKAFAHRAFLSRTQSRWGVICESDYVEGLLAAVFPVTLMRR